MTIEAQVGKTKPWEALTADEKAKKVRVVETGEVYDFAFTRYLTAEAMRELVLLTLKVIDADTVGVVKQIRKSDFGGRKNLEKLRDTDRGIISTRVLKKEEINRWLNEVGEGRLMPIRWKSG